jgi:hypothetical protein
MALNLVNIGAAPGDGTGDPARTAFGKVNAAIASVSSQVYNVRDFGAVGNGVADDRAAIQAAINAASAAGGGTVFLPPGTYAIATRNTVSGKHALTLASRIRMVGAGMGATIIKAADALPSDTPLLWMTAVEYVSFADFTLDGNKQRFGGGHSYTLEDEGIDTKGACKRIVIERLHIRNTGQDGIDIDNGDISFDLLVSGCVFEDCGGLSLHNGMNNTTMRDCIVRRCAVERGVAGITNAWASNLNHNNSRYINCHFEDCYGPVTFDLVAVGREIIGCTASNPTTGPSFQAINGATARIVGGRYVANTSFAISIDTTGTGSMVVGALAVGAASQNTIHINAGETLVANCRTQGGAVGVFSSGLNNTITGNRIVGATTVGVRTQGATTTAGSITSNHVTGGPGLNIRFSATGIVAMNNNFSGAVSNESGTNIIRNNVISGVFDAGS